MSRSSSLDGYFKERDITGNSQGLLQTNFAECNYSHVDSMITDFRAAALADGYEPSVHTITLLFARYRDYTTYCRAKYFTVDSRGSVEEHSDWAEEVLDSARINRSMAESKGLALCITQLNGADLWDWCKERTHIGD